jgi:Leucine-rich repeat (LRR) protein
MCTRAISSAPDGACPPGQIESVPPFRHLYSLTHADLRHNRLREVPREAFGHLTRLEFLDISFNSIRSFPPGGAWPPDKEPFWLDTALSFPQQAGRPPGPAPAPSPADT